MVTMAMAAHTNAAASHAGRASASEDRTKRPLVGDGPHHEESCDRGDGSPDGGRHPGDALPPQRLPPRDADRAANEPLAALAA